MSEQIDWQQITHYAGFDWAKDHHDVVVVNQQGRIVEQLTFEHTPKAGISGKNWSKTILTWP
jgi:hypothetical protein